MAFWVFLCSAYFVYFLVYFAVFSLVCHTTFPSLAAVNYSLSTYLPAVPGSARSCGLFVAVTFCEPSRDFLCFFVNTSVHLSFCAVLV